MIHFLKRSFSNEKICWIFSINVRGMAPFGYSTTMNLRQAKSFQEKIKTLLPAEIETQFISYDISSNDIPAADLLVFNDMDSNYLSEEIKTRHCCFFKDMVFGNTTVIKNNSERPKFRRNLNSFSACNNNDTLSYL